MFGIAPGSERVGCGVLDDVNPRLWYARGDSQAFNDVVQLVVFRFVRGLRVAHRQRDLVGREIGTPRQQDGEDDGCAEPPVSRVREISEEEANDAYKDDKEG